MHPTRRQALAAAVAAAVPFARPAPAADDLPTTGPADKRLASFDDLLTRFVAEHKIPGASLAVTKDGKLVYARGYGVAVVGEKRPVQPTSLFRIASISKPITAVGVLQLAERKKLKLDDPVLDHLTLEAFVPKGAKPDPRWKQITVRHCLQHTGGWDRDKSGDPCFKIWQIAKEMSTETPVPPDQIVRYMLGQPLDADPGTKYAYSNLGYLVLGAIVEAVTKQTYEEFVLKSVFAPLKITEPKLCRVFPADRPKTEVGYADANKKTGRCLYPPKRGEQVPFPDGAMNVESFAAHGGWVASAVDLVRFAAALDYGRKSPLLAEESIAAMWAPPAGEPGHGKDGKAKAVYYGCGWQVRPQGKGRANAWHTGLIPGTSTLLVRRHDGLNWAVLFNTDRTPDGKTVLAGLIDGPLHAAADAVKEWPTEEPKLG